MGISALNATLWSKLLTERPVGRWIALGTLLWWATWMAFLIDLLGFQLGRLNWPRAFLLDLISFALFSP